MLDTEAYTPNVATSDTLPPVMVDTGRPRVRVRAQIGPYAILPLWLLQHRDLNGKLLTSSDLRVLLALRSYVSTTRRKVYPGHRDLADRAGVARGTVENAITRLRRLGLVRSRQRHCAETGALVGCEYWLKDVPDHPISYDDESPITTETGPWALVPMWVLAVKGPDGKGLNGTELRTYIALRSYASADDGSAWPLVSSIASRAGVARGSAHNALTRLRSLQLIKTVQMRNSCNYYEIQDMRPVRPAGERMPVEAAPETSAATPPAGTGSPQEDPWVAAPTGTGSPQQDPWTAAPIPPRPSPPGNEDTPPPVGEATYPLGDEAELTNKELTKRTNQHGAARAARPADAAPAGLRPRLRTPDAEEQDRALFTRLVGDTLNIRDQHWRVVGACTAERAYDLIHTRYKITAPGAYLAAIGAAEYGGLNAIDEWLMPRGLERTC